MGMHPCEYCHTALSAGIAQVSLENRFQISSTGDVEIFIEVQGHEYKFVVPDMILHYIHDHGYSPCPNFINAILHGDIFKVIRMQTKGIPMASDENLKWFVEHGYTPVGYLSGELAIGEVPAGFVEKLMDVMLGAEGSPLEKY